MKVVITCLQMQEALQEVLEQVEVPEVEFVCPEITGQHFEADEMKNLLVSADYAIVGDDVVSESVVSNSSLKGLIKWGIGYDSVDVEALSLHGTKFSNTPGQFAPDVSEQAIALLFAVERGLVQVDAAVRSGGWLKYRGRRIEGRSVLVLGFGNLGRALSDKLCALGLKVSAYDPYVSNSDHVSRVTIYKDFPFRARFDYLISCLPLNQETERFVNNKTLSVLNKGGVFVNVSRGRVVDEGDLESSLKFGLLGGAGLDVYEQEPLSVSNSLKGLSNVVLGAHNSSNTYEGVLEASVAALYIIQEWMSEG